MHKNPLGNLYMQIWEALRGPIESEDEVVTKEFVFLFPLGILMFSQM